MIVTVIGVAANAFDFDFANATPPDVSPIRNTGRYFASADTLLTSDLQLFRADHRPAGVYD